MIIGGACLAVIHGSVSVINQFVFASTPTQVKERELDQSGVDGVVGGHCGLPSTQIIGTRLWHNAGVIGMPANDGSPRVWFSLLSQTENGLRIVHRALSYDYQTAATKIHRTKLPSDYAFALSTGIWPSCDILPARERQAQGVAMKPETFVWTKEKDVTRRQRGRF